MKQLVTPSTDSCSETAKRIARGSPRSADGPSRDSERDEPGPFHRRQARPEERFVLRELRVAERADVQRIRDERARHHARRLVRYVRGKWNHEAYSIPSFRWTIRNAAADSPLT
jgi:hypothetical protein